jgi:hypothetical protein
MLFSRLRSKGFLQGRHLNFEGVTLRDTDGERIAEIISHNSAAIKRITITDHQIKAATFKKMLAALEKNIHITHFLIHKKPSAALYNQIKAQLVLNRAQEYVMSSVNKASPVLKILLFVVSVIVTFKNLLKSVSWPAALAGTLIYQGLYQGLYEGGRALLHRWYRNDHLFAKSSANIKSLPKQRSYQLGQRCAKEWLVWVNPRSWTPLAYLGHTIEKRKLHEAYGVNPAPQKRNRRG